MLRYPLAPAYWKSHQCHGLKFGGKVNLSPPPNSAGTCFFTPILRLPNPALWRLYAGYSYHLVVNYTNGVDMNWLYLLLVLALAGYLLRALARTHE
ncbi:hypothetical protein [Aeromonas enteropelogenes]